MSKRSKRSSTSILDLPCDCVTEVTNFLHKKEECLALLKTSRFFYEIFNNPNFFGNRNVVFSLPLRFMYRMKQKVVDRLRKKKEREMKKKKKRLKKKISKREREEVEKKTEEFVNKGLVLLSSNEPIYFVARLRFQVEKLYRRRLVDPGRINPYDYEMDLEKLKKVMKRFKNLVELRLTGWNEFNGEFIFQGNFSRLESLSIGSFSEDGEKMFFKSFKKVDFLRMIPRLKELRVKSCYPMNLPNFVQSVASLTRLCRLELDFWAERSRINSSFGKEFKMLKSFRVIVGGLGQDRTTAQFLKILKDVFHNFEKLTSLNISLFAQTGIFGSKLCCDILKLDEILFPSQKLVSLILIDNHQIISVGDLSLLFPNLKYLEISPVHGIAENSIVNLTRLETFLVQNEVVKVTWGGGLETATEKYKGNLAEMVWKKLLPPNLRKIKVCDCQKPIDLEKEDPKWQFGTVTIENVFIRRSCGCKYCKQCVVCGNIKASQSCKKCGNSFCWPQHVYSKLNRCLICENDFCFECDPSFIKPDCSYCEGDLLGENFGACTTCKENTSEAVLRELQVLLKKCEQCGDRELCDMHFGKDDKRCRLCIGGYKL